MQKKPAIRSCLSAATRRAQSIACLRIGLPPRRSAMLSIVTITMNRERLFKDDDTRLLRDPVEC
jgi:hypothetical protein